MTRADVDAYFEQIPVWMKNDIRREIALARATRDEGTRKILEELELLGDGNLLAALGLVAYTEALGRVRLWNETPRRQGGAEESFLAFFDQMHERRYEAWRTAWERAHPTTTVYETLRCGLVHEYQPKIESEVWIGDGAELGLDEEKGRLIFKVEPYYRHFCAEADRLYEQLKAMADPEIPPPQLRSARSTATIAVSGSAAAMPSPAAVVATKPSS